MQIVLLLVFLTGFESVLHTEKDTQCLTPDSKNGTCVVITNCPETGKFVSSNNKTQIEYALKSQCDYEDLPLVCCKSPVFPKVADYSSFFTKPTPKPENTELKYYNIEGLPNRTVCGLIKSGQKLFEGKLPEIGEFPWAVALGYVFKETKEYAGVRCGGSLIHKRYVLTAVHCMEHVEVNLTVAILGEWKLSNHPDCFKKDCAARDQKIDISELIPHELYNWKTRVHDIGLLRLARDVEFNSFVSPICLPPSELPVPKIGDTFIIVGWGGNATDVLRRVELNIISNRECKNIYSGDALVDKNQLCAGGGEGADALDNACQGDLGGPLLRTYSDLLRAQWYQEGVVSYGDPCKYKFPTVYIRVSRYIRWIFRHIQNFR